MTGRYKEGQRVKIVEEGCVYYLDNFNGTIMTPFNENTLLYEVYLDNYSEDHGSLAFYHVELKEDDE